MTGHIEQEQNEKPDDLGEVIGVFGASEQYNRIIKGLIVGGVVFCVWCGAIAFLKMEQVGLNQRTVELLLCLVLIGFLGFMLSRKRERKTELFENGVRQTGYFRTKTVLFSELQGYRIFTTEPNYGHSFPKRWVVLIPQPRKGISGFSVDLAFVGMNVFLSYISKRLPGENDIPEDLKMT